MGVSIRANQSSKCGKMFINKLCYIILLTFVVCSCRIETDRSLSDSFDKDEKQFDVDTIDKITKHLLDSIWNKQYERSEYEAYIKTLNILLEKGYLHSADKLSSKVDTRNISPERLTGFYDVLGAICMYTEKPDSAIHYFRHVYIQYPIAPQHVGHNRLHFYNDAVMSMIEAYRCADAKTYFDSLKIVVAEYPDSLFYIGGVSRLNEFKQYIGEICNQQKEK